MNFTKLYRPDINSERTTPTFIIRKEKRCYISLVGIRIFPLRNTAPTRIFLGKFISFNFLFEKAELDKISASITSPNPSPKL